MIDWNKPVRRADDKTPATVIKVNEDGTAWVHAGAVYAYLLDKYGRRGVYSVENVPEPRILWVRDFQAAGSILYRDIPPKSYSFSVPFNDYLLDLTDPDAPKIERVTK